MTSFSTIYDAFLSKILDDEWGSWTEEELHTDLKTLLEAAIPRFKFPRASLAYNDDSFLIDLNNEEIQILANYMKCEWLNRSILTWENVKPLYEERDFSQANLLDKLNESLKSEQKNAEKLEAIYYRSIKGRPFDYSRLAGG